jgi:DNA-binding LacI/PurR family transcriptional regulator
MPATLSDVANLAGVSVKTVSNVVSGYAHVSTWTRARVESALAELDYRPNLSARNLRRGRSGVIALAVPDLGEYFAEIAFLAGRAVEEEGFTLLIDQTEGLIERENRVVEGIREQLIDGLIFSPLAIGGKEIAKRRDTTPLVLLGERISGGLLDHIAIDNVAAAREAVSHLINIGRRRIAVIGAHGTICGEAARLRLAGYRDALVEGGIPYVRRLVVPTPPGRRAHGLLAARQLLAQKQPPDAIFALNDHLAIGALRALHEAGARVPDDVAVVGFDDIEEGRFSTPTLTTVSPDKEAIARSAVTHLVARVRGAERLPPRDTVIPHRFIVRESTVSQAAGRSS